MTVADIEWDKEHPLFKGNIFGSLKIGYKKYTVVKGWLAGGSYSISGNIDGEYQEIDVQTEEELNSIIQEL